MSKHEDTWEDLDSEFDHHLVDMKPHVLKLPHKTERQRCALWIKKLCDPAAPGSGLTGRKNRNMYARLLLHMLRRGVLEGPFTQRPEPGGLKTLPTYMSIYFDEPLCGRGLEQDLPDWVTGELEDRAYPHTHRKRLMEEKEKSPSGPLASSPVKRSSRDDNRPVDRQRKPASPELSHLEARLNSWNLGVENPRYLREDPLPLSPVLRSSLGRSISLAEDQGSLLIQEKEKEVDMRTRLLEAKHQEDKLRMQQRHDADVQKILERKNGELEDLKAMYRAKHKESEDSIRRLEKKVQSVVRESQVVRESRDQQMAELRKMADQSADSQKNQWEKKLHAAAAVLEQEKFDLQKKHTENIQELLEDTNHRLAKMEAEYGAQTTATEQTVRELELRVRQLSVEVENGNALRMKVTQEKNQLEIHIAAISSELQEANRRNASLLREREADAEQHEHAVRELQAKQQADASHYQQEHALSTAKAAEVMEDLEHTVAQLRQQLQDCEHRRQKQLRDQEMKLQQEKADLQHDTERKVRALHTEAERERAEAKARIAKLDESLRQQAEALEQLRRQTELSAQNNHHDMKLQMEKVEENLRHSKSLREKQAKEFSHQLEDLKQKYEQQMVEQRVQQEEQRRSQQEQHAAEREELEQERRRHESQTSDATDALRLRYTQTVAELEAALASRGEELQQAHAQRKQQLLELAALREDERRRHAQDQENERRRHAQDQETALGRLSAETERLRLDQERTHRAERELDQNQASSRLKQMEKDFSQKLAQSAQLIAALQTEACAAKEEGLRVQQGLARTLEENKALWDQERRSLTSHAHASAKALQAQMENVHRQLRSSEKKLLNKELENQEQITAVRQECEAQIKGLMPAELRQDLEDTIASLKTQVNFLQKRASVLQDDLDACRSRR